MVVGVCVLMTGAITNLLVVGIVGFGVMLASATVALNAIRGQQAAAAAVCRSQGAYPSAASLRPMASKTAGSSGAQVASPST